MAWIESHQNLADHPKTRKLARILDISKPTTIGHLHCFWWWALDYADDGDLSRFDSLDIAIGAEWDGDPDEFLQALIRSGFVDDDDGLSIHDWWDYAGKLIERRRANAKRMREARARQSDAEIDSDSARAENVQRTQRARVERPTNQPTEPDQTEPFGGADAPTPPQKPNPKGTRLPADFTVTDEMREWAKSEGASDRLITFETDKFLDYWPTVPGQKGVKLDWERTWKNWMRKAIQDAPAGTLRVVNGASPFAGAGFDPLRSMPKDEHDAYLRELEESKRRTAEIERQLEEDRKRGLAS